MKRWLKILGGILLALVIIVVINFIPALNKQDSGMSVMDNEYFTFYYFPDDEGAQDVYDLALSEAPRLIEDLRLEDIDKIEIYIYEDQDLMQRKYVGYAAYLMDLPWFIGGANQNQLVMVSPATPNEIHDYDTILQTILHEIGHTYNYQLNPNLDLWLDEAMAMVLAGQGANSTPTNAIGVPIPTYQQSKTQNPLTFQEIEGYLFARLYANYLIDEYGYDAWLQLLKSGDYDATYNKDQEAIYDEWVDYMVAYQEDNG